MDMGAALLNTLLATGLTFLCTTIGSAAVFFMKPRRAPDDAGPRLAETLSLGFAAGIMVAAAVWSLLIPGMEAAESAGISPVAAAVGGFLAGAFFLKFLDMAMPHLHPGASAPEGPKTKLLHNLPEGGSVGLTSGMAALADSAPSLSAALALAIGIGIQNIPEGAAVSIPMAEQGYSRMKAFLFGAFSGVVEPVCGVVVVLGLPFFAPLMPFMLAFAAGAMLYVVVEELIPSAHLSEHSDAGTLAFIFGFALMMALDVALG